MILQALYFLNVQRKQVSIMKKYNTVMFMVAQLK